MKGPRATRRSFLKAASAVVLTAGSVVRESTSAGAAAFDMYEKSIGELQKAMSARQITSVQLVQFYRDRIAAYDQAGPRVNAVLYLNPNSLADARALDEERRRRGARGPLHGIPVLLKDNFDTKDMPTTGGALALSGLVPTEDAFQVRKLREAGVVILGKVNLHELALGLTTVSSLGGQTLDPYDLARAPGGSSGGSGVAVAANFAAFAMGTDTSGSIRIPSSHNGIVGLRPSAGLSSRAGIIPFGHTQDSGGPMARTVADIAVILDATAGYDAADPVTATSNGKIARTYTSALKRGVLKGARVGVLSAFFGDAPEDQEVGVLVRRAIEDMKAQGATVVELTVPNLGPQLLASNLLVQELKFYLGDYLRASGAPVNSVEELLASGLHSAQLQGFLEGANTISDDYLRGEEYKVRLAARAALGQAIVKVMDENRVDAIVYPVTRRIAPIVGGNQVGSNAGLAAQTGFPAITVPAGLTPGGFPVGMELLGRPFAESTLIGLAYAFEQATLRRRPPSTTPPITTTRIANVRGAESVATRTGETSVETTATGAASIPPSDIPFSAIVRFSFEAPTRLLRYEIVPSGASPEQIAGVYLHRRANRQNGGVAYILAKTLTDRISGTIALQESEANDLKAGKLYVSAVGKNPRLSARANLVLPPA